ncbi:restriction endonuclease subunit S, partial [Amylibacter sp.]|nr:restriction endonuclease subunit S [Amylibacter sp.]
SANFQSQFKDALQGLIGGVSLSKMKKFRISYPPLAEQQRIVAKLDAAFAEIDGAITTSKAQAENISSLKRKFISNALTIDIQAKPLGDCCAFLNGYAFKSGDAVETSETQLLRMGNLYENRLDLERKPVFYPDEYANQHSRYVLAKDDIVMTLTGTVGKQDYGYALKIGDTEKTLLLNQRILKLHDFNSTVINQEYLLYFLQSESFLAELYATANGTRQANLSSDTIKKLKIPVPSLDKQEKAVAAFKLMDDYHHQFFECLMEKISNLSTLKSTLLAQELQSEAA